MAQGKLRAEIHEHHLTPFKVLLGTFLGLIILTVLTVLTAALDLGAANVPIALTIATTKAVLVVLFFMALKYDNQVNTLVLSVGLIMVVVFITFTLFDTAFRGDISNVNPQTIMEIEREQQALETGGAEAAAPQGGEH